MKIIEQESTLRNNSTATSDWIGQIKGSVIYAVDLGNLFPQGNVNPYLKGVSYVNDENTRIINEYLYRFKDAWEKLAEK